MNSATVPELAHDLLDPRQLVDPHPLYHRIRAETPVCWSPQLRSWLLFRYADVVRALKDPRLRSERVGLLVRLQVPDAPAGALDDYTRMLGKTCLMSDPPQHTRLRAIASAGFLPRAIQAYRPLVEQAVDELLAGLEGKPHLDVVRDFCDPLPSMVIARILGVPEADREQFLAWTLPATRLFGSSQLPLEAALEGQRGATGMRAWFTELIERRRREGDLGQEDVVGYIVRTGQERGLDAEQVATLCVEVLGAAHNTTMDVLGNAILTLLRNPAQLRRFLDDPAPVPNAVDELMRYEGPGLFTNRVAAEPLEIAGHTIQPGELVTTMLAAANRDPEVFPDPDRFDVGRANAHRHVGFGYGPHFCLGAPLARVELAVALPALFRRFPTLRLEPAAPISWRESVQLRGPTSLVVRV